VSGSRAEPPPCAPALSPAVLPAYEALRRTVLERAADRVPGLGVLLGRGMAAWARACAAAPATPEATPGPTLPTPACAGSTERRELVRLLVAMTLGARSQGEIHP